MFGPLVPPPWKRMGARFIRNVPRPPKAKIKSTDGVRPCKAGHSGDYERLATGPVDDLASGAVSSITLARQGVMASRITMILDGSMARL